MEKRQKIRSNDVLSKKYIVSLLAAFCMMIHVGRANDHTYYFSSSGNDGNKGTSATYPKKSLQAAQALAKPGNTLLFKKGDSWYISPNSFDLQNIMGDKQSYLTIGSYGKGKKPVIAGLKLLSDKKWKRIPRTTTWMQAVTGFSDAYRLYVNGISKYKVNTSNSAADQRDVDKTYKWYIKPLEAYKSGIVYVNTGSADKAPTRVEIHPHGAAATFIMKNSGFIKIRGIDIRGGANGNVVYVDAPSTDITIEDCIIRQANGSGIQFENSGRSDRKAFVSNVVVQNCLIDKVWSSYENDPAIILKGDGIFFRHAVDGALARGNTILNWGHSGISITTYEEGMHGVRHVVAEVNDISAGESGYMHALDMNGFEGMTTHNIIRRNYFHDYTTTNHISGSFNQIYSNIFAGVRGTKMPKHSYQPFAADWITWQYQGKGPWLTAHDNYLVNNTFYDIQEYGIMISDDPSNPNMTDNNIIANNIFFRYGHSRNGKIAVNVHPNLRGATYIYNNSAWDSSATDQFARYRNAGKENNYTTRSLDKEYPDLCRDNVQLDPCFADPRKRDFRLTERTPVSIREGGTTKYNEALGKDFTDYYGKKWSPDRPSIGAIQY